MIEKTRKLIVALIVGITFSGFATAEDIGKKVELPDELNNTYKEFVAAMKAGDAGAINSCCLPQSVTFTYEKRGDHPEFGQDINMPYAKNGFNGDIVSVRKDGEGCYLIRTVTTAMWFIQTKSMGWKLYRYVDKPIM